jgi:hypothetical protein
VHADSSRPNQPGPQGNTSPKNRFGNTWHASHAEITPISGTGR